MKRISERDPSLIGQSQISHWTLSHKARTHVECSLLDTKCPLLVDPLTNGFVIPHCWKHDFLHGEHLRKHLKENWIFLAVILWNCPLFHQLKKITSKTRNSLPSAIFLFCNWLSNRNTFFPLCIKLGGTYARQTWCHLAYQYFMVTCEDKGWHSPKTRNDTKKP